MRPHRSRHLFQSSEDALDIVHVEYEAFVLEAASISEELAR